MENETRTLKTLLTRIGESTKKFYHSTLLADYESEGIKAEYGIRELLLLAAVTNNNVILTGRSQSGKTHLAKMVMSALFGSNYGFLPVDITLNENKLRNLSFGAIKEGKNLNDAVKETKLISAPGVIVDEYNRAPYEITNILQGYLQNGTLVFEGGKEMTPGTPFSNGKYQWKIATLNEGRKYGGAREVEKASRNRLPIEIPLDVFTPTEEDERKIILHGKAGLDVEKKQPLTHLVIEFYEKINQVPLEATAEEFIMYLTRLNQCTKSPEKSKLTIENFSMDYCKGCRHIVKDNGICGNVFAPSERSIIALSGLAKGFAIIRYAKAQDKTKKQQDIKATIEDVLEAAPFTLYSKIDIEPNWVEKYAQGSKWKATKDVIKKCYDRFTRFFAKNEEVLKRGAETEEDKQNLEKYATEEDPWCLNLKDFQG